MINVRFMTLVGMVLAGAAMRLIPHPPNFTPIAAMALFGGAHFASRRAALAVPLAAMLLSDLVLSGGYHTLMPVIYTCFALTVVMGMAVRGRQRPVPIVGAALAGSVMFFVVTNLGVWVVSGFYPKTLAGLAACYTAAIPFFRNTLAGDLVFTAVLFGAFAAAERVFPAVREPAAVRLSA